MDTEVLYHQEKRVSQKPGKPKNIFSYILEVFYEFFGEKETKKDSKEMDNSVSRIGELSHSIYFLKKMLSGHFDNYTIDSFESSEDKSLFEKFNKMSLDRKKEEYKNLEKELHQVELAL